MKQEYRAVKDFTKTSARYPSHISRLQDLYFSFKMVVNRDEEVALYQDTAT